MTCPGGGTQEVSTGRGRDRTAIGGGAVAGRRRRRPGAASDVHRVEIRLSHAEYRAISAATRRVPGRPLSLSRYIGEAALAAAGAAPPPQRQVRSPSRLALAELMDAVTAVNRVGNNLNQLAREKNTTGLRPVGTRDAEHRALAALHRLAAVVERLADGAA